MCANFLAGKSVRVGNKAEVINFEKQWNKIDTEIDIIVGYMNIGKHDLVSLRQLLSNYITIYMEINTSLPTFDEFKKIVDGLTKPSFQGCRLSFKRIFCKTAFDLCGVTKKNCVKKCENVKQRNCKEQLTAIDLIVKLLPHSQNQFTCHELCQRRVYSV